MRDWLVKLRKEAGHKQITVAKATGTSQSAISLIEHGKRNPTVSTAKKIAECIGFDWKMFYDEEVEI